MVSQMTLYFIVDYQKIEYGMCHRTYTFTPTRKEKSYFFKLKRKQHNITYRRIYPLYMDRRSCLLDAGVRGVRGVRAARGVLGVRGVRGELVLLPAFLLEGEPNTLRSVFSTHASASVAILTGLSAFSLSSSQNLTGESNFADLYMHSVSMSKLKRLMKRFLSLAYCSAINRFVSSRSGAPNKHLQLPRLLLGVFEVLSAIPADISNLLCLGVRPPAAISYRSARQVSTDWLPRNI
ncbi:hypothetical protein HW555_000506 [Spodoptera exigua]|uniref:Uncharacterized protein n=1 Tax=Spodoptera exigua TaxID=7107 RepID=A0A835GU84_SPOEX|nr:hypothetical protein HW555_000506 [Spodoptera exigua]